MLLHVSATCLAVALYLCAVLASSVASVEVV